MSIDHLVVKMYQFFEIVHFNVMPLCNVILFCWQIEKI